jgi:DNA-binding MarR family transcriptional regulator
MTAESGLDPVIHGPVRLRVMVTLSTLRDEDSLTFTRLQELLDLTPGNLITHLRKLEDAGYVTTIKSGRGVTGRTSVSLTRLGRQALETYTTALRQLLDLASTNAANSSHPAPAPGAR